MIGNTKDIFWINSLKAICMIFVYLLHSEIYYGINEISYGYFLKPFYVNGFFFVSGYLFFKKHLVSSATQQSRNGIINLIYRLIIPTIIFSTIIYLPKILFHEQGFSITQYFYDVFGGTSYWFTSTLTIAQFILIFLLLFKTKNIFFYLSISAVLFFLGCILSKVDPTPFPWYYKSGMGATLLMSIGGLYQKYEQKINKIIGLYGYIAICIIYIIVMYMDFNKQFSLMSMNINIYGFITIFLGIMFILGISKLIPQNRILNYIGKNSIVFYFFSGMIPAIVGKLFQQIFPNKLYVITLLVASVSIALGMIAVWIINKYLPFLIDLRSLLSNERKSS